MAPISATIHVSRCADDVYAYTTDPSRFAQWQRGVVSGRMQPGTAPGQPERCIMVRRIGVTQRTSTSELIHADPPRSWSVKGIDGPIRARVNVTVTPVDTSRSAVTIAVDFKGHGVGKLLVPLIARRQAAHEMPANLATLKRQLENNP
jgi:hypothetical protein